jgi:2-oxoglutarate dehydrogenase E2 component (dihydrolipoamide succinyltransferase)
MSVTVSMPQLGESVTEGTVTRWLKKEGEHVEADEPLLEVSTDKVDTEIPSPASGILRGITVAEDETVAVGAQLAVIDDAADGDAAAPAGGQAQAAQPGPSALPPQYAQPEQAAPAQAGPEPGSYPYAVTQPALPPQEYAQPAPAYQVPTAPAEPQYRPAVPEYNAPYGQGPEAGYAPPAEPGYAAPPAEGYRVPPQQQGYAPPVAAPAPQHAPPQQSAAPQAPPGAPAAPPPGGPAGDTGLAAAPQPPPGAPAPEAPAQPGPLQPAAEGPYITPLVRKLAAEHGVNLAAVAGTGVGGRIRKQDVLEAARVRREQEQPPAAPQAPAAADGHAAAPGTVPGAPAPVPAPVRTIVPSTLRGTTERMSRARQLIARRMVESLQTSAQLTTVIEADVTAITRLRERAKADFEAREGVRLSYLPFFALAALEALKIHPKLNAVVNTEAGQIIYHDAEHLGIAVDTERGLMVPVIRNAGDLNIGGLARKIADLAARTRAGQVSPDELAGGTFTLTNTGSRGALFDTPIINQPQVAILGTGTVVKRPVVMEDPALGEVITVRSMVYLALTYDHRLIDGADAARYLATVKDRLEEGAFEAELGL